MNYEPNWCEMYWESEAKFTLSIPMLDDKQGVAVSVNNTIGLNINQDTEHKNLGQWTCLGAGAGSQGCDGI